MKWNVEVGVDIPYPKKFYYSGIEARSITYAVKYALKMYENDKKKQLKGKHIDHIYIKGYKI